MWERIIVPTVRAGRITIAGSKQNGLTAAFIVAAMGAVLLAALGVAPERGGSTVIMAATANARGVDLAHVFRGVFAIGVLCLLVSLIALIWMDERPLRGRSEQTPPIA